MIGTPCFVFNEKNIICKLDDKLFSCDSKLRHYNPSQSKDGK